MDKKRVTELILLQAAGSTNEQEQEELKILQQTEENFPWNVLADFQNKISLMPSVLSTETPSEKIKESFLKKMDSVSDSKDKVVKSNILGPGVELVSFEPVRNIISKNKNDHKKLNPPQTEIQETKEINGAKEEKQLEEVLPLDKEGFIPVSKHKPVFGDNSFESNFELDEISNKNYTRKSQGFRKYILAASIVFMVSVVLFGFFYLKSDDETVKVATESFKPKVILPPVVEKLQTDSLIEVTVAEQLPGDVTEKVPEEIPEKILTKEKDEKQLASSDIVPEKTIIPKPPEEIKIPLIEPTLEVPSEEKKEIKELTNPPREEITAIEKEPVYFVAVEEMPEPIGGIAEIQKKIEYPEIAKRAGLEGKVYVRAYVDENGDVIKAEVVKGLGGGCDEAALDAIVKTKFSPGTQRGKPIKVQVTIPIIFKL
ncbi:MAG: TonB family protein [Ignavibacteriaceae bacterium]